MDDRYVGQPLGDLRSGPRAPQALADRAGDAVELLHIDPDGHEPRARDEAAQLVAAAQRSVAEVGVGIGGPSSG